MSKLLKISILLPCNFLIAAIMLSMTAHAAQGVALQPDDKKPAVAMPATGPSPPDEYSSKKILLEIAAGDNDSILFIKPNDSIKRMLVRDCGLSGEKADKLVAAVKKKNKMLSVNRLFVGQRIVVPDMKCLPSNATTAAMTPASAIAKEKALIPETKVEPQVVIEKTVAKPALAIKTPPANIQITKASSADPISTLIRVWENIVSASPESQKPLSFKSGSLAISLDPARYPVFPAMDGGRIVVDQHKSIPSQYISLIAEQEPALRIVAEPFDNKKRFLAVLIGAARFYSVEENFKLVFGADPKLVVNADFKVERTAESLLKNEVLLLNVDKPAFSAPLSAFLKKGGFVLYEPFKTHNKPKQLLKNRLVQITVKTQPEIIDALLTALSIPYKRDQLLEFTPRNNNGIAVSIQTRHSFEFNGRHFAALPANTLPNDSVAKILDSNGYQLLSLTDSDDFITTVEKLLTSIGIRGKYGFHQLQPADSVGHSLQLSGVMVKGKKTGSGSLLITNLEIKGIFRDIAMENGYTVQ